MKILGASDTRQDKKKIYSRSKDINLNKTPLTTGESILVKALLMNLLPKYINIGNTYFSWEDPGLATIARVASVRLERRKACLMRGGGGSDGSGMARVPGGLLARHGCEC